MDAEDQNRVGLEEKCAFLERHVGEQDTEMFRLAQRIAKLEKRLADQDARLEALSQSREGAAGPSLADERPPHY